MTKSKYFFRKISWAKWRHVNDEDTEATSGGTVDAIADESIGADAVTRDLQTKGNTLSLWLGHPSERDDIILALAASMPHLSKVDVAWIDERIVRSVADLTQTAGDTPVTDLQGRHYDAKDLTLSSLAVIAPAIARSVRDLRSQRWHRASVADVKRLLRQAVDGGRVSKSDLNEGLRKHLGPSRGN